MSNHTDDDDDVVLRAKQRATRNSMPALSIPLSLSSSLSSLRKTSTGNDDSQQQQQQQQRLSPTSPSQAAAAAAAEVPNSPHVNIRPFEYKTTEDVDHSMNSVKKNIASVMSALHGGEKSQLAEDVVLIGKEKKSLVNKYLLTFINTTDIN